MLCQPPTGQSFEELADESFNNMSLEKQPEEETKQEQSVRSDSAAASLGAMSNRARVGGAKYSHIRTLYPTNNMIGISSPKKNTR